MALLESCAFLAGIIFEIPSSAFADLLGRKKTVLLGWLISGISYIFIGASNSLFGLVVGMLFVGIGGAFVSGADTALIYDFLKKYDHEDYYPKLNVLGNFFYRFSMIFAIYAGGYLSTLNLGLNYIFRGTFQLFSLIPILLLVEVPFVREKLSYSSYIAQLKRGFVYITQNSYMQDIIIYYSLIASITWSCLYYFNNSFANDVGFSPQGQSFVFSLIYVITTTALFCLLNYTNFVKNTKLVLYVFPFMLLVALLPGFVATKLSAFFMLVGVILAGGARFSVLDGLLNKLLESKDRATTLSTINMGVNVLFIILMLVGGQIQNYFSTKEMFSLMGLIVLFVVLPFTHRIVIKHKI
ncbi:MFS transporter [candidate division WWE3 bacterium]|nr:MFS transporter [candidate division WWE3 bacterium]